MSGAAALAAALRPRQWVKNVFVLAALVFARRYGDLESVLRAFGAFLAFCLASSAGYLLNDCLDRARDRAHPDKRLRPVASGRIGMTSALLASAALAAAALLAGLVLGGWLPGSPLALPHFLLAYLALGALYSLALKHCPVADVLAIAAGFVLRAYAGGAAIEVEVSRWLALLTFLVALLLALAKRRAEAALPAAERARPALARYSPRALDAALVLVAVAIVVAYVAYAVADRTVAAFGGRTLLATVPPAAAGVVRALVLARRAALPDPTLFVWRDRPLQAALALWCAAVAWALTQDRGGP